MMALKENYGEDSGPMSCIRALSLTQGPRYDTPSHHNTERVISSQWEVSLLPEGSFEVIPSKLPAMVACGTGQDGETQALSDNS